MNKALFLDRDGVINLERGDYTHRVEDFKILPLFMAGGGHVDRDIPKQIAEIKEKFTDLNIDLLPPIGENKAFRDLIKQIVIHYIS